jgi:hypothetical protein
MATPIKRIEKDYLLKVLYDDQIPILYLRNRTEYVMRLEKPAKQDIQLQADRPIPGLKPRKKMDLMFDHLGKVVTFSIEVGSLRNNHIIAEAPEFLYKNLGRSHSRVVPPPDLQIQFTLQGDRYSLSFPTIAEYESMEIDAFKQRLDPRNFSGLIDQLGEWSKGFANGHKLILFKDAKLNIIEEKILAETGKTIFLPSTTGTLPQTDPYPKKRLVTADMLKRYLESTGVGEAYLDEAASRFIRSKFDNGIFAEVWVPVFFQEYVIGCIHLWISSKEGLPPLDYGIIDTLYQFAQVLAFSLKINGYFDSGRIKNEPFAGNVIDISTSGLLFAYPRSNFAESLLLDTELLIKLTAPMRTVNAIARIVRRYNDKTTFYFGCRFLDMSPEDTRFLFEFIYGKPFTEADASFLSGNV